MKARAILLGILVLFMLAVFAQQPRPGRDPNRPGDETDPFPRGRKQTEELLKAEHVKNVADATELARIANELKDELDNTDAHVLSTSALKKTEEIEKLAHRIRGRIKH
jgi:hypothetical protein